MNSAIFYFYWILSIFLVMNVHDENYTCSILFGTLRFSEISDFQDLKIKHWVPMYSKTQ